MREIDQATSEICMFGGDLSWVNRFWPSLWNAVSRGVMVRILFSSGARTDRISRLRLLGAQLRETGESYLLRGSLIDPSVPRAAILVDPDRTSGRLLAKEPDAPLIAALSAFFVKLWNAGGAAEAAAAMHLIPVDPMAIIRELKRTIYYEMATTLAFERVVVPMTKPLTVALETVKARAARKLITTLQIQQTALFHPLVARDGGTFVAPPVVEKVDGELVVIDGAHRLYECLRLGIDDVHAIVVRNCNMPLPAAIGSWDHVFPRPEWLERNQRYRQYNEGVWRDLKSVWRAFANPSATAQR